MTLYCLFTNILEAPVASIFYSDDEGSMSSKTFITTYSTIHNNDDNDNDNNDDDDDKEQNQNLQLYENLTSHTIVLICYPLKVSCMTEFCTLKKEMKQVVMH
jgi:hypothetical protein